MTFKYLKTLGLEEGAFYNNQISGVISLDKMDDFVDNECVRQISPALMINNTGLVTTEGDKALGADLARNKFSVDGKNIKIGTLSDSYDALKGATADVKSRDLPADVVILPPMIDKGGTDEGRAMMQILHDVSPGAKLYFRTTMLGEADFAKGIDDLVKAGVQIINDDVLYFTEPFFQDGSIAQATEAAAKEGVHYFSAAANLGEKSYEAPFRPSGENAPQAGSGSSLTGAAHDFDPGEGRDIEQKFSLPAHGTLSVVFQWAQPFVSGCKGACRGPTTNLDLGLLDKSSNTYVAIANDDNPQTGTAFEFITYTNNSDKDIDLDLVIANASGPDPELIKYVVIKGPLPSEYQNKSATSFGHANANGIISVASASWFNIRPPFYAVNSNSSLGGMPIYFDENGVHLKDALVRPRPFITGPDGGSNTFFGIKSKKDPEGSPKFFGTSAAAPHIAAVAALILENASKASNIVSPELMEKIMRYAALDISQEKKGFSHKSGYGFLQAEKAVCADIDSDGVCIDKDECPEDPEKTKRGDCGCGVKEGTCT